MHLITEIQGEGSQNEQTNEEKDPNVYLESSLLPIIDGTGSEKTNL